VIADTSRNGQRLNKLRHGIGECSADRSSAMRYEGQCMSRDRATGMVAYEPRSSQTTAKQFVEGSYFMAHRKIIRVPSTVRMSTLDAVRR
jgi:hypothetical protein